MNAIEKAKRDLERGDHWLARQRLGSYLISTGYDPDLLAHLGNISYEMHDAHDAGRMWLTSTAEGERVDRAIATFVQRAGKDARQVAAQLPRVARLANVGDYPAIVQKRLRRLGLDEAITRSARTATVQTQPGKWVGRLVLLTFLAVVAFFVVSCALGLGRIFSWIFRDT